MWECTI